MLPEEDAGLCPGFQDCVGLNILFSKTTAALKQEVHSTFFLDIKWANLAELGAAAEIKSQNNLAHVLETGVHPALFLGPFIKRMIR
jgi:hypothetical protein